MTLPDLRRIRGLFGYLSLVELERLEAAAARYDAQEWRRRKATRRGLQPVVEMLPVKENHHD